MRFLITPGVGSVVPLDGDGGSTGQSQPAPTDNSNGDDDSASSSGSLLGNQPATVQLGSGFIVGCVVGVVLYTVVRISMRMFKRSRGNRPRREQEVSGGGAPVQGVMFQV